MSEEEDLTLTSAITLGPEDRPTDLSVPTIGLEIVDGPHVGTRLPAAAPPVRIGSHPSNSAVIDDPTVSRFHCEIRLTDEGAVVRDAGSHNGTRIDGVRAIEAFVRHGSLLALGDTTLRVELGGERATIRLSDREHFGDLVGRSPAMRSVFALLERCAPTDVTVLLEGETGTGKEAAAVGIHEASPRAAGPFVVVDCGAIPENLLESELFGHEKGAFTGADSRRIGAFESGSGGTVFLDELGELPPALQPKLLRTLEERTVRRLGSHQRIPVDIRLIAATNRRLEREVNEGAFRSDLYYRLAVLRVELPPLRARPSDVPSIAEHLLERLGASEEERTALMTRSFLARLARAAWPGNVRELRNYLERCLVMREALPLGAPHFEEAATGPSIDPSLPYTEARQRALAAFERNWLPQLLQQHGGNVTAAARAAGMDRVYLHRLLRRHGMR